MVLCPGFRMLGGDIEAIKYNSINLEMRKLSYKEDITFTQSDGASNRTEVMTISQDVCLLFWYS
jgi:hypothetical protein